MKKGKYGRLQVIEKEQIAAKDRPYIWKLESDYLLARQVMFLLFDEVDIPKSKRVRLMALLDRRFLPPITRLTNGLEQFQWDLGKRKRTE